MTSSFHLFYLSARATASIDRASVVGANDEPIDCTKSIDDEDGNSFWQTSQGKFKFRLDQLPPHLQVIYSLLQVRHFKQKLQIKENYFLLVSGRC